MPSRSDLLTWIFSGWPARAPAPKTETDAPIDDAAIDATAAAIESAFATQQALDPALRDVQIRPFNWYERVTGGRRKQAHHLALLPGQNVIAYNPAAIAADPDTTPRQVVAHELTHAGQREQQGYLRYLVNALVREPRHAYGLGPLETAAMQREYDIYRSYRDRDVLLPIEPDVPAPGARVRLAQATAPTSTTPQWNLDGLTIDPARARQAGVTSPAPRAGAPRWNLEGLTLDPTRGQRGRGGGAGPAGTPAGGVAPGGRGGGPSESLGMLDDPAVTAGLTANATRAGEPDPSYVRQAAAALGETFDPRTPEGRLNLTATAAAGVMTYATGGLGAGAVPWVLRVLGPPAAAALAGGTEVAAEKALGTRSVTTSPIREGAIQGAYEAGGQAMLWPVRRTLRSLVAPRVARTAHTALDADLTATRQAGEVALDTARQAMTDRLDAARLLARATTETARSEGRALTAAARTRAAETLAAQELDSTARVAAVTAQYDALLGEAPSILEATGLARGVVHGPAKRALDMAGERVAAAAAKGPAINLAPVKAALDDMAAAARPGFLLQDDAAQSGIGFLSNIRAAPRGAAASAGGATAEEAAQLQQRIAQALGVSEQHPLPGLLGQLQRAPDTITFADAHKLKRLLDESVTWDRTARRHLEQITKGVRQVLREQMAGFAEYDAATAAYESIVPLYRRGVGRDLLRAAADHPDRVARLLKPNEPARAQALHDLLVGQSAAGGERAAGQRAWDAIRSTFTYDHLLRGGLDGLSTRVQTLVTTHPEFARIVFNDDASRRVLVNLATIGDAYQQATAQQATARTATRQAGAASVRAARDEAADRLRQATQEGADAVAAARQAGQADLRATRQATQAATAAARGELERLQESSIGRYVHDRALESDIAHGVAAAAVGPSRPWGLFSIIRLMNGPRGADLLEWASYSSANTRRLVQVLESRATDRVGAALAREMAIIAAPSREDAESPAAAPWR